MGCQRCGVLFFWILFWGTGNLVCWDYGLLENWDPGFPAFWLHGAGMGRNRLVQIAS